MIGLLGRCTSCGVVDSLHPEEEVCGRCYTLMEAALDDSFHFERANYGDTESKDVWDMDEEGRVYAHSPYDDIPF